jgi:acyl carrier protein
LGRFSKGIQINKLSRKESSAGALSKNQEEKIMVFEKIAGMISEHFSIDINTITEDTTFESLGIDSLDTVEMVMQLEEDLGIEIELEEKMATIGELAKFIETKLG